MSDPAHNDLLDQLQAQVNLVLEQTGRVFAAIASNPKVPPVAQITKLQHVLHSASNRFHKALDQLENELQIAALVMRRDLALCRESSNAGGEAADKVSSEFLPSQTTSAGVGSPEKQIFDKTDESPQEDVAMQDSAPEIVATEEKPVTPDAKVDSTPAVENTVGSPPQNAKRISQDANSDGAPGVPTGQDEGQPASLNGSLHVEPPTTTEDSTKEEKPTEDEATDTATGDMDSLFNDPIGVEDTTNTDTFAFDQNSSNELDFSAFGNGFDATGADNDNISSLLPGLEDYANTQTNAATDVIDFDSFFNTGNDGQNADMNQESGEQRDTTLDDFMDLANFEALDGEENNNNGNNNNTELDFDSLFN